MTKSPRVGSRSFEIFASTPHVAHPLGFIDPTNMQGEQKVLTLEQSHTEAFPEFLEIVLRTISTLFFVF